MPAKVPDSDERKICERYLAGETSGKIAKDFSIHAGTVASILKRNGIQPVNRKPVVIPWNKKDIPVEDMVRMYNSGMSGNAISKHLGVSRTVIERRLDELGVVRRGQTEANRLMMAGRSREENIRNTLAANMATRGKPQPEERMRKIALGRERKLNHVGEDEFTLWALLWDRCIAFTPQKAVGRYNIDIALKEFPIAVEVFGGMWHAYGSHARRFRHRLDYLLDRGWLPVIVWTDKANWPIGPGVVEYLASLIQVFRSNKPFVRQEHVIRGDGNICAIGKANLDYRAAVGGDKCGDLIRGIDGRFTREASGM